MTLGSLFDGSGGFPLAGSLCGITPVWAAEVEPYPIAVTRSRFPHMEHLGDVSKVNGAQIEPVDAITFGSPCQDLSVAGKRKGLKHEANGDDETTRSGLFLEAVRIIKEMRAATHGKYPTFALWENVPGAFSSNGGEDFRVVLEELAKIAEAGVSVPRPPKWEHAGCIMGDDWSIAWRTLDAQYWGVPQRRRRIYLVADFGGQRAGKVLFEREGLRRNFTQSRAAWQGAAADAERSTGTDDCPYTLKIRSGCEGGGKGALIQKDKSATLSCNNDQYLFQPVVYGISAFESNAMKSNNPHSGVYEAEPSRTLDLNGGNPACNQGGMAVVCYDCRGNGDGEIVPTLTGDHENRVTDYTSVAVYSQQRIGEYVENEKASTLMARDFKSAKDLAVTVDCRNLRENVEISGTLQAKPNGGQSLNYTNPVRVHYIVRRLTPTECARLQGFPDRWGDIYPYNQAEYEEWLNVRQTYDAINGRAPKAYTPAQIESWYNKLHTDSAEYKMWGNGIALPTALYVMEGIAKELEGET